MSDADALLLEAVAALNGLKTVAATNVDSRTARRTLARLFEQVATTKLQTAWARWHAVCALSEATLQLEDELFTARSSLRRAHAMLVAVQQRSHHGL